MRMITQLSPQNHVQTAVIGAGVIGLSIARALACQKSHEVLIIEQSGTIGSGISSRNSEVIHAGIYYDRDKMPLKSKFCVEGKTMMYDYCKERFIPHRKCGKLIVATDAEQRDFGLPNLLKRGDRNGVRDLQIISKEDVACIEPNVVSEGAIISPSTGIVDSYALMTNLLADAEYCGATLALHSRCEGGRVVQSQNENTRVSIVLNVDGTEVGCENVVICCGLSSDKLASNILSSRNKTSDKNMQSILPTQFYSKGNYFKLKNQASPFTRLIYPFPDPNGGLGVHSTIDLYNHTKFGPDVQWLPFEIVDPNLIDMNVDETRMSSFVCAIKKYWPSLEEGNLVADYSGVRPKLSHPTIGIPKIEDFVIVGEEKHGIQGLVVLLGFESPGLTSSLAIGEHVAKLLW